MTTYSRTDDTLYSSTGYMGDITGETETHYIVRWFFNPRNGNGIENRSFLKSEVK